MKSEAIKVDGMVCGGCENRVKNALQTLEGVNSVEASYKDGIVKVDFDDSVDINKIKEKIEDIGFEVKE